jgi:hypothetical protein
MSRVLSFWRTVERTRPTPSGVGRARVADARVRPRRARREPRLASQRHSRRVVPSGARVCPSRTGSTRAPGGDHRVDVGRRRRFRSDPGRRARRSPREHPFVRNRLGDRIWSSQVTTVMYCRIAPLREAAEAAARPCRQSLYGSSSFSPAITTMSGRRVWRTSIVPSCAARTSGRRR